MVPAPKHLVLAPLASEGLQGFLVFAGVAADPEPRTADLNVEAGELQKLDNDAAELFRGFCCLVVLVGACVVRGFQSLKHAVVLGVDRLHRGDVAANVRMMDRGQLAVSNTEFVKGLAICEILCHNEYVLS